MIGGDEDFKSFLLCCCQQFAVFQRVPAALKDGFHLMRIKRLAQGYRRSLVEEDAHSSDLGRGQAFRCVVKHRPHLLCGDTREPLDELSDLRAIFEILEKGADRNPRAAKHPRTADTIGITLDG